MFFQRYCENFMRLRFHKSSEVTVWGSGTPIREFMHCDDLASALLFLLKDYSEYEHINVGSGDGGIYS